MKSGSFSPQELPSLSKKQTSSDSTVPAISSSWDSSSSMVASLHSVPTSPTLSSTRSSLVLNSETIATNNLVNILLWHIYCILKIGLLGHWLDYHIYCSPLLLAFYWCPCYVLSYFVLSSMPNRSFTLFNARAPCTVSRACLQQSRGYSSSLSRCNQSVPHNRHTSISSSWSHYTPCCWTQDIWRPRMWSVQLGQSCSSKFAHTLLQVSRNLSS